MQIYYVIIENQMNFKVLFKLRQKEEKIVYILRSFLKRSYIAIFSDFFSTMSFVFMNKSILFLNVSGIFILLTFFLDNSITRKIPRQMVEEKKKKELLVKAFQAIIIFISKVAVKS